MGSGLEELGIVDDAADAPKQPEQAAKPEPAPTPEDLTAELERQLRKVSLFEGLLPVHLRRISSLVHEVRLEKGQAIFRHGDAGDGLYLIVEGSIRISRNVSGIGEEALAVLAPGMYFGEMSIVDDDSPRSADAIAHESARLLMLPKDDLRDLMFVDRELAYELLWRFVRTLSLRLRESNDRLLMLTVSSKF
ncbi:MAG: cyclic nucleotide-binding domain-containing protein [Nannocystaceae bacterium]|nr:cyclic nucleotide-binding domain-containing protein [bacterium]